MQNIATTMFGPHFLEKLKYHTPLFVFSKKKLVQNFHEFMHLFPGSEIEYAMKANSEPEILKTLHDLGSGFEIASAYELRILEKIKVPPNKILYGTSVKPASHIKEAFAYGVDRFAFDSPAELEKIAAAAPGSRVIVRVVVNDAGSVFRFSEKFGTEKENAVQLLLLAKKLGLQSYGISFHVGSQASNPFAWSNALKSLHHTLVELKKANIKIDAVDIGGGFPCAYSAIEPSLHIKEIAEITIKAYKKLPYHPKMILEPGRGIIASTGILLTTVIARVERKGYSWLFLDAGVYNALFEAMAYQGSTRYKVTSLRRSFDSGEMLFALAGPTGDSPDIITQEALLPKDIEIGDQLVIHDVGAYSLVVTSKFNGFPKPGVLLA